MEQKLQSAYTRHGSSPALAASSGVVTTRWTKFMFAVSERSTSSSSDDALVVFVRDFIMILKVSAGKKISSAMSIRTPDPFVLTVSLVTGWLKVSSATALSPGTGFSSKIMYLEIRFDASSVTSTCLMVGLLHPSPSMRTKALPVEQLVP